MYKIKRSVLTELVLTSVVVNTPTKFNNIPQLRGKKSVIVQSFDSSELTVSPNGNAVVPTLTGLVLMLFVDSTQTIEEIPLFTLSRRNNGGLLMYFDFKRFNLDKSFIKVTSGAGIAVNQSVPIQFCYEEN